MNMVWLWRLLLERGPAALRRRAVERLAEEPGGLKDPDAEVRCRAAELVTARMLAAVAGADVATLAGLLEAGGDPNAADGEGQPLMVVSLKTGKGQEIEEVVSLLVRAGADPNQAGPKRTSPLELALGTGSAKLVRLLLGAKADPNGRTASGLYPLRHAVNSGNPELVQELLAAGAKVDLADQQSAPLLMSVLKEVKDPAKEEIAGLLLGAGAHPNRSDRKGLTPLEWALRERRHALVALLLKA